MGVMRLSTRCWDNNLIATEQTLVAAHLIHLIRLSARTPAFHADKTGSIPVSSTKQGETTPCPYKDVQNLNRVACETRHDGNK